MLPAKEVDKAADKAAAAARAKDGGKGGKGPAGEGKAAVPPLAGKPKADLGKAAPGSIVNTASLEGLSHAVYAMVVQGAKVYSGLYNGNIQARHMDAYGNLCSLWLCSLWRCSRWLCLL